LHEARSAYDRASFAEADVLCRRILRQYPTDAGALHLLGELHAIRGDPLEAVRLIRQSLAYSPDNCDAWCDLAKASHNCGFSEEAIRHLKQTISLQPNFFRAYRELATLYYQLSRTSEAAQLYRDWANRDPTNAEVLHMVAATSNEYPPARCSDAYIRTHFDKLAPTFDKRLVEHLRYRGHAIVVAALARYASADGALTNILDAGCGTGLCGPLLRPYCCRLVGVDLSEKMIECARRRTTYDELVAAEICTFMDSNPGEFAAIVAADVLIYMGALEQAIRSAHRALRPGGLLAVTFERLIGSGLEPYRLEGHGRYSHRDVYIRDTLSRFEFEILHLEQEPIRRELEKDVVGFIVVAQKLA
jgi:predicted TPR repeat methyltransferase